MFDEHELHIELVKMDSIYLKVLDGWCKEHMTVDSKLLFFGLVWFGLSIYFFSRFVFSLGIEYICLVCLLFKGFDLTATKPFTY